MCKLIIVDDEKLIQNSISKYISGFLPEFELCGCFYDGEDALQYLMEHPVDIVLTDICMPNMDGLELAREVCNRFPHCIMIIISGYSEFEYARTAIKYNVFNYLLKPLDFRELKKCLLEARDLSRSRRQTYLPETDLREEATELFFADLLMGLISTREELEEKFRPLALPFPLDRTGGVLIRITVNREEVSKNWNYGMDQLEVSLKNMIQLTLAQTYVYFVRRSDLDYSYLIMGLDAVHADQGHIADTLIRTTKDLLKLSCTVRFHQQFSCLADLIHTDQSMAAQLPPASSSERSGSHTSAKTASEDAVIQKAIEYIERNYASDLTRESVANAVFLSPSYFSYQFKKKTGISFIDYLTNVRMQKAIELLGTHMKINDIAQKVGYQSRNRFFINFRQYTTYNPTEYRKKILCMEDTNEGENKRMENHFTKK